MKKLFGSHNKTDDSGDNAIVDLQGGGDAQLPPGLQCLYSPQVAEKAHVRDIVDILGESGKLTEDQIEQMRREESNRGDCDIEHLVLKAGVGEDDVLMAKAELYGFKFRSLESKDVDRAAFEKLDLSYIRNSHIIPIEVEGDTLVVATSEPANVFAIDDVKRQTGLGMKVVVCTAANIDAICDEFDDSSFDYNVDEIFNDMSEVEVVQDIEQDTEDLEKSAGESPVIKFVNYLLTNSLQSGASDIHIEPKEKYTKVRYRIDGILFDTMQAPAKMHPAVVSRLKIMANLDISERRLPQDGKIAVRMGGRGIDLRVSVLPTSHGEKVVIRILDSKSVMRGLEESGMEAKTLEEFRGQIAMPHGILLVTGPTGSGKSTTLYSALSEMESDELNVSTVEDPVEYNLEFCNQVQVIERIGLTFAASLRSLLRQDPDIIMIGEIRDNETARISVQAALTGHLVLSTLHTNDAPSSISRLVNIGIEPYLIAASLNGILAQRLVRRICTHCKEPHKISGNMRKHVEAAGIDIKNVVHGAGCDECRGTGYAGRAGIFELMIIDDVFRDIINKDSSVNSMRLAFRESKQPSLFDDGMEKVQQGLTTVEEVLRVTQVYGQTEDEAFVENLGEDRKGKSGSGMTKDKKAAKAAKKSQPVMVTEELLHDVDDIDPAATDTEK